jgi:hypothetical protein
VVIVVTNNISQTWKYKAIYSVNLLLRDVLLVEWDIILLSICSELNDFERELLNIIQFISKIITIQ